MASNYRKIESELIRASSGVMISFLKLMVLAVNEIPILRRFEKILFIVHLFHEESRQLLHHRITQRKPLRRRPQPLGVLRVNFKQPFTQQQL